MIISQRDPNDDPAANAIIVFTNVLVSFGRVIRFLSCCQIAGQFRREFGSRRCRINGLIRLIRNRLFFGRILPGNFSKDQAFRKVAAALILVGTNAT
jgi:hypothetical protein